MSFSTKFLNTIRSAQKNRIKNLFSLFLVLITGWASLATSSRQVSLNNGSAHIISDCVTPALEADVTLTMGQISSPGTLTYSSFGFPSNTVDLFSNVEGPFNGYVRKCVRSFGGNTTDQEFVFSCSDNGSFNCNILILKN